MSLKQINPISKIMTFAGLLSASFGCSPSHLQKLAELSVAPKIETSKLEGEFCTLNLNTPPGLKFYFIIDVTGSNQWNDPGRTKRTNGMQLLVDKYPTAKYALQTFSGEVGNNVYVPFQSADDFRGTLATFLSKSAEDIGGTPYAKTLQDANKNITDYLLQQVALPRAQRDATGPIVVIYISDGMPTDGVTVDAVAQLTLDILRKPMALNALEIVDEIIANSGMYGSEAKDPLELKQIANSGYGTFIDFNTGVIDFTRFRIPTDRAPTSDSFGLFATNLNVIYEKNENGEVTLEADSDGDGLSDKAELAFQDKKLAPALSEFNPDTDGNGVSDGIEAFYFKTPCAKNDCSKPIRSEDVRKPVSCDFIPEKEGGPTGYYTKDILNNCEKLITLANYKMFSTISDKIPDGVKVRNGISPKDTTLGQSDPSNENMTTLQKLMFNLPWWFPNAKAAGYLPTVYDVTFEGLKDNRSCYAFSIKDIPFKTTATAPGADPASSQSNRIRIWLTQSDRDLRDVLRVADIMISKGQSIHVKDTDFKD